MEATYFAALSQGKTNDSTLRRLQARYFYPRQFCPHCDNETPTWEQASGAGTVHSVTTLRTKPDRPYNISWLIWTRGSHDGPVDGIAPDEVKIGMRVHARIIEQGGKPLVVFLTLAGGRMNESFFAARSRSRAGTAGCGDASGFTDMEILAKAARSAVHDAGLKMSDIDGIATANLSAALWPLNVVEYLNVRPSCRWNQHRRTSFIGHMLPAARA